MAEYTLTVHVDQHWVSDFNKHNMKLCFAAGVQSGGDTQYNVVAFSSSSVAAKIIISWRDAFSIAACKDEFSNGAKFSEETTIQSIKFGQTYTLPADWTDKRPNTDPKAPKAGFRFANKTEGSAVLYKQVEGRLSPIYISSGGPLPPGHEDIIPKASCRVWFANEIETQTMIGDYQSNYMEIDMTGNTTAEVRFDPTGAWLNM